MTIRLEDLLARDAMRDAVSISAGASLRAAAELMWDTGADAVVVLGNDGALVGLLSERDLIFGAVAEAEGHAGTVGAHANRCFLLASMDEPLAEVVDRMAAGATRRAVVTGRTGEPVGLISLAVPLVLDEAWGRAAQARRCAERSIARGPRTPADGVPGEDELEAEAPPLGEGRAQGRAASV